MGRGARRVLVLDIDGDSLHEIEAVLGPTFSVEKVTTTTEALRLLAQWPVALVVAEEEDGIELLAATSHVAPLARRVLLTAEPRVDAILRAINDAGACAVLRKPLGASELARLQTIASQRAATAGEAADDDADPRWLELTEQVRSLTRALEQKTSTIDRLTKQLAATAVRDRVTGLYNERYFFERAEQELKRARRHTLPLGLVLCDAGGLAAVGGARSDDPIGELARALAGHGPDPALRVRDTDVVARYAGDVLGLLLPGTHKRGALVVAGRVRSTAAAQLRAPPAVCIGVAAFPDDASCTGELIERADEALYFAKASGKSLIAAAAAGGPALVGDDVPVLAEG